MPFDANGNFSLVPGTIVADGLNILPSQHNPPFQDVANGLSQAVVRDGRAPMTGPLNMNGYKITGVAAGDAPDDVVTNAAIADLGVAIGDGKWSLRDLSPNWLRRDGKLYLRSEYPDLAAQLPPMPDGVLWEPRLSPGARRHFGITYGASRYISVANGLTIGSGSVIVGSLDGANWASYATMAGMIIYDVAFGAGVFLAADIESQKVLTSPDGVNWSETATLPNYVTTVTYSAELGLFFAGGQSGYIISSDDASTWITRTTGTTVAIQKIREVNGRVVATASGGTILHSVNGTDWTVVPVPAFSGQLLDVAYKSGVYVVVGQSGSIFTSTDLSTWVPRTSGVGTSLNGVTAGESGFMAVGDNGVVRISSDGTSWAAAPTGTTEQFRAAIVDPTNGNRYIVVGPPNSIFDGLRTEPTQFRAPNDDPTYGWIRAL